MKGRARGMLLRNFKLLFSVLFLSLCFGSLDLQGGCGGYIASKWNYTPDDILSALDIHIKDDELFSLGDDVYFDLSQHEKAKSFFAAYNVMIQGRRDVSGVFHPEHFIVRPLKQPEPGFPKLEAYRINSAFMPNLSPKGWSEDFLRHKDKLSGWWGTFQGSDEIGLQQAYEFQLNETGIKHHFILVPKSVYPPFEYSRALVHSVMHGLQRRSPQRILVLGSGAGYDALNFAMAFPEASIVATDISEASLTVGAVNAKLLGVSHQIRFVKSNLFEDVNGTFDLIVFVAPRPVKADRIKELLGLPTNVSPKQLANFADTTLFDLDGQILTKYLSDVGKHLSSNGEAFLMTDSDYQRDFGEARGLISYPASKPKPWQPNSADLSAFQIFKFSHPK